MPTFTKDQHQEKARAMITRLLRERPLLILNGSKYALDPKTLGSRGLSVQATGARGKVYSIVSCPAATVWGQPGAEVFALGGLNGRQCRSLSFALLPDGAVIELKN